MIGFFDYDENNRSMGRLIAFIMTISGVLIILVSLALTIASYVHRAYEVIPQLVAMLGLGTAVDIGGGIMKNWSKRGET